MYVESVEKERGKYAYLQEYSHVVYILAASKYVMVCTCMCESEKDTRERERMIECVGEIERDSLYIHY